MKRRGFTLIELMVVIAIIIILTAIAIPNYLNMTKRAKNSRLQSDMATLATALETFKTDWGLYPTISTTAFDNVNTSTTNVYWELSGNGTGTEPTTALNKASAINAVGEKNNSAAPFIEYIKAGTLTSMVNPFDATTSMQYGSANGSHWVLYADTKDTSNSSANRYMTRTDNSSTPIYSASIPASQ